MSFMHKISWVGLLFLTSVLSGCDIPKVYRGIDHLLPTCLYCPFVQATPQTVAEDQANAPITLTVTDSDSTAVTLAVKATTANGTLTCPVNPNTTAGNLTSGFTFTFNCTYTPNLNYNGADSFDVVATDNALPTASASTTTTIPITVTPVNDAPVWGTNPATMTFNEDTPTTFTVTATDVDGPALTFASFSTPAKGGIGCSAPSLVGITYTTTCTYIPGLNKNGADTFSMQASDGTLTSAASALIGVTINPVNDSPVINSAPAINTPEDTAATTTVNVTDVDGVAPTVSVTGAPANGAVGCGAATMVNATTWTYVCTFTPNLNWNGTDSFIVQASDGLAFVSTTVGVTVTPVNDAPVITAAPALTTNEDTAGTTTVTVTDVDGPTPTLTVSTVPTKGSAACGTATVVNATTWTYVCTLTPTLNLNGADSFAVRASDGTLTSAPSTITVTINPVNDPPVINSAPAITTLEDTAGTTTLNVTDVDGVAPTITITTAPALGGVTCGAATVVNATTWTYLCTFTPTLNLNGADSFIVQASDGLAFVTSNVGVTITPVNDAPVWGTNPATMTFNEDTPTTFTVTATDVDGPALTFASVAAPTKGAITCAASSVVGTTYTSVCTFTPTLNLNGADSFTMRATDGTLTTATTAAITVTITPVNDAPVWGTNPASMTFNEDTAGNFTVTATDVDGPALTFASFSTPAKGGIGCSAPSLVGITYTATCTHNPGLNMNGADTFSMQASDGTLTSAASALIGVTINPVNDPPVITGTPVSQAFNSGVAQNLTLANMGITGVTDPDIATNGDVLTYSIAGQPTGALASVPFAVGATTGTITGTASGEGTVSPEPYTVTLTVTDSGGGQGAGFNMSASANVPFSVTDVTPPVVPVVHVNRSTAGLNVLEVTFSPGSADQSGVIICQHVKGTPVPTATLVAGTGACSSGVLTQAAAWAGTSFIPAIAGGPNDFAVYAYDEVMLLGPGVNITLTPKTVFAGGGYQASFMTPITGALGTFALASGASSAGGAVTDPAGRFVFTSDFASNTVSAYSIDQVTGLVTSVGVPIAKTTTGMTLSRQMAIDPAGRYLYVVGQTSNSVASFAIGGTGILTAVTGSPYSTMDATAVATSPQSLAVHPSGQLLFVNNSGDKTMAAFAVGGGGVLTQLDLNLGVGGLQNFALTPAPMASLSVAVTPGGNCAYVGTQTGVGQYGIYAYTVNMAATPPFTAVTGSPFVSATPPNHMTTNLTGSVLYAAGGTSLQAFTVDQVTVPCALTSAATLANATTSPEGLTLDPTGQYLYIPNNQYNIGVDAFSVGATGTTLSKIANYPILTNTMDIAVIGLWQ
ncbi:MAG: Ig-like domain-containing protein [Deltaproteobacteria bacterium]|nr:Ig-like domain-containing protein [Deltaproteobacteria bacterium]